MISKEFSTMISAIVLKLEKVHFWIFSSREKKSFIEKKIISSLIKIINNYCNLKKKLDILKRPPSPQKGQLTSVTVNDWKTETYWVFPVFSVISSRWLSLIYRKTIDFCMFILHPIILLNCLVNTNRFSVNSLGVF